MSEEMRVMVAVDDSAGSERALDYAGALLGNVPHARLCLLHVLGPLPAELASTEPPSDDQRDAQAAWMMEAREGARPLLERAKQALLGAGIGGDAVESHTVDSPEGDLAKAILAAAREARCDTIVVGRDAISWAPQLFHRHVGEDVVHEGRGVAVWVVG